MLPAGNVLLSWSLTEPAAHLVAQLATAWPQLRGDD